MILIHTEIEEEVEVEEDSVLVPSDIWEEEEDDVKIPPDLW
jgi:hypothetical protein